MRPVSPCTGTLPTGREFSVPKVLVMKNRAAGHLFFKHSILPVAASDKPFREQYQLDDRDTPPP
ncbi:hypothetical protein SAMN02787076_05504 [Rhizobacter sp. OV335]|nr:hypothetical protein SAMN02787076_05504 [Rhizobacter sp. OV335]